MLHFQLCRPLLKMQSQIFMCTVVKLTWMVTAARNTEAEILNSDEFKNNLILWASMKTIEDLCLPLLFCRFATPLALAQFVFPHFSIGQRLWEEASILHYLSLRATTSTSPAIVQEIRQGWKSYCSHDFAACFNISAGPCRRRNCRTS